MWLLGKHGHLVDESRLVGVPHPQYASTVSIVQTLCYTLKLVFFNQRRAFFGMGADGP